MAKTGAIEPPDKPADLTEELPLDDENVLATPPPSFWRRYRWPLVAAAVVVIAAAIALPLWLTSGSSTPTGLTITTVTVPVTTGHDSADGRELGHPRAGQPSHPQLRRLGHRHRRRRKAGQTVTAGQVLATVDTTALTGGCQRGAGPADRGRGPPRRATRLRAPRRARSTPTRPRSRRPSPRSRPRRPT